MMRGECGATSAGSWCHGPASDMTPTRPLRVWRAGAGGGSSSASVRFVIVGLAEQPAPSVVRLLATALVSSAVVAIGGWAHIDPSVTRRLHQEILDLVSYLQPTREEFAMRLDLIDRLESVVQSVWPQATVCTHGPLRSAPWAGCYIRRLAVSAGQGVR
jgi:hypothetical protein